MAQKIVLVLAVLAAAYFGFLHFSQPGQEIREASETILLYEDGDFKVTKDSRHVYINGEIIKVDNAGPNYGNEPDAATFVYVGGNGEYFKDKDFVYHTTWQYFSGREVADLESFEVVGEEYTKDAVHVYWGREPLLEADPATFVVFDSVRSCGQHCTYSAGDKNHKYLQNQVVQADSVPSLQKLDDTFATDGTFVYAVYSPTLDLYANPPVKLEGIDAKTFKLRCLLGGLYEFACDSSHLISPGLAVVVKGNYDLASLQKLEGGYFKDKQYVYRLHHSNAMDRVEGADLDTFTFVNDDSIDAQDKNQVYFCGILFDPNNSARACY
ncbi:MAG: hypothetical protein JWL87_251 [Candidatus Adlerbacteria bacterium]|nr:hypothetical protein [Candidatus Adlerbacteria bacterium]